MVFECIPAKYRYNSISAVHGGLTCILAAFAMGAAPCMRCYRLRVSMRLEIKTNLLRAMAVETGRLLCEGKTTHVGRSVAVAEARLTDEAGKLYAHAATTRLVFEGAREYSASKGER